MRVFSYVIVRDRGGAPNLEPPLPTLEQAENGGRWR